MNAEAILISEINSVGIRLASSVFLPGYEYGYRGNSDAHRSGPQWNLSCLRTLTLSQQPYNDIISIQQARASNNNGAVV